MPDYRFCSTMNEWLDEMIKIEIDKIEFIFSAYNSIDVKVPQLIAQSLGKRTSFVVIEMHRLNDNNTITKSHRVQTTNRHQSVNIYPAETATNYL